MPELPEVETVMRGLETALLGKRIKRVLLRRADLRHVFPAGLAKAMEGAVITSFRRRAKYMLMRLDNGYSVLWHLGMSGRMVLGEAAEHKHEHVVVECSDGTRVGFVDPRRFGALDLMRTDGEDEHKFLAGLGPEPLGNEFSAGFLAEKFDGKRTSVKAALLDQKLVAGLGNIYVCEALYRARIHPERLAADVKKREFAPLASAIKQTLTDAIAAGGSSLRDYVQASGELGYFQHQWRVYGREGEACPDCKAGTCPGVKRIVQSGRSSFFCEKLQK